MTQVEKMELFIRAMKREVELEFKHKLSTNWNKLSWDTNRMAFNYEIPFGYEEHTHTTIEVLADVDIEIRIAKSLPLLSDADADFAEKYLPHGWWIARDSNSVEDENLYVYDEKPRKASTYWVGGSNGLAINIMIPTFPKFESIKWENEDRYTIQELLDYYKENKK